MINAKTVITIVMGVVTGIVSGVTAIGDKKKTEAVEQLVAQNTQLVEVVKDLTDKLNK